MDIPESRVELFAKLYFLAYPLDMTEKRVTDVGKLFADMPIKMSAYLGKSVLELMYDRTFCKYFAIRVDPRNPLVHYIRPIKSVSPQVDSLDRERLKSKMQLESATPFALDRTQPSISERFDMQFSQGTGLAGSTLPVQKPFHIWCSEDATARSHVSDIKRIMESRPMMSQELNEGRLWAEWGAYCTKCGKGSGGLKEAFSNIGFEIRGSYYGLPNKPSEYWPSNATMVQHYAFSGYLKTINTQVGNRKFLIVGLENCIAEDAADSERLNAFHMIPAEKAESIEAEREIYGKYRKNGSDGVVLVELSHERPSIGGEVKCDHVCEGSEAEHEFLERFSRYVLQAGFSYDERDLIRFHTGVKIGLMTILTGAPGVGKSSLVRLYAKALAGSDSERYLRVFVNPTWNQPADFIGEMDPIRKEKNPFKFKPAGNGVYERLVDAITDPGRISVLCLEEMNLAPVEYYFSDIIQLLDGEDDVIPNVSSVKDGDPNENPLRLSKSLRMFGTCNSDASTHPLTPRFLDRCNYMTLASHASAELLSSISRPSVENIVPEDSDKPVDPDDLNKGWRRKADDPLPPWEDDDGGLDEVYNRIRTALKAIGIVPSNRVERHVKMYILNRPGVAASYKELQLLALDEAVVQMVLPRCRLNSSLMSGVQDVLTEFEDVFGGDSLCWNFLAAKRDEFVNSGL